MIRTLSTFEFYIYRQRWESFAQQVTDLARSMPVVVNISVHVSEWGYGVYSKVTIVIQDYDLDYTTHFITKVKELLNGEG